MVFKRCAWLILHLPVRVFFTINQFLIKARHPTTHEESFSFIKDSGEVVESPEN